MKLEEVNLKTKEAVNYLVQSLEAGQSSVLTQYLGAMAKFRNYSFGNIMLIASQKPDATHVAGLRTWNFAWPLRPAWRERHFHSRPNGREQAQ